MDALIYVMKRTLKNNVKTLFKKPVSILYLLIIVSYVFMIFQAFTSKQLRSLPIFDSVNNLVLALSIAIFFFEIPSILMYAKRKGVVFKVSDVHFIFSAPISPKLVLVFAQIKGIIISVIIEIVIAIVALVFFKAPFIQVLLYASIKLIIGIMYEYGVLILLYGNESIGERGIKIIRAFAYLIILSIAACIAYLYFNVDSSWGVFSLIFNHPLIQCVPIIGWNIALIRLIFLGATTVNIVCSILYVISMLTIFIIAVRIKCTGEYYEDAMKFAEDYQELRKKASKGEVSVSFNPGKKKKYQKAGIVYKGYYAKAIFYRQLLEYKKERFFIFSGSTLICFIISGILVYLGLTTDLADSPARYFIIPGIGAYFIFVASSMATKWTKEMENAYTYLIPDTPLKKLWYATIIDHIKNLINACLLAIPAGIVLRLSPIYIILDILIYVLLSASRLYLEILIAALFGNVLGKVGKPLMKMFGFGIVIGFSVVCGLILGLITKDFFAGFAAMTVGLVVMTILTAIGGSLAFSKMDVAD
jgi:hypothetical protein